jgi:hypothetical protein
MLEAAEEALLPAVLSLAFSAFLCAENMLPIKCVCSKLIVETTHCKGYQKRYIQCANLQDECASGIKIHYNSCKNNTSQILAY